MGWAGSHGDFNHEFTTTMGNRVSRFEEFVSYKHNDTTFAVASQGQLMNMMNGLRVQLGMLHSTGGANLGFQHNFKNAAGGLVHERGIMMF